MNVTFIEFVQIGLLFLHITLIWYDIRALPKVWRRYFYMVATIWVWVNGFE